jgi:hypothetical protein
MKLRSSDEEIKKVEALPQTPENIALLRSLKLNHGGFVHNFATARDNYDRLYASLSEAKELLKL